MRPSPQTAPADAQRTWWINKLASKPQRLAQDTFAAPGSLGRTAGRAYASLPEEGAAEISELTVDASMTAHKVRRALHRLHLAGLAERSEAGWHRSPSVTSGFVAIALGVDGYLLERSTRYEIERVSGHGGTPSARGCVNAIRSAAAGELQPVSRSLLRTIGPTSRDIREAQPAIPTMPKLEHSSRPASSASSAPMSSQPRWVSRLLDPVGFLWERFVLRVAERVTRA